MSNLSNVPIPDFTQATRKEWIVKDEDGVLQQRPLYCLPIEKEPLPAIQYTLTYNEYKQLDEAEFEKLSPEDQRARNIIFDLIMLTPFLWSSTDLVVPKKDWEELAVELYCRTGYVLRAEEILKVWNVGRHYLRKKLNYAITKRHRNEGGTEEYLSHWGSYNHIRFYRATLASYEKELRNAAAGLEANLQEISQWERDDNIIFEEDKKGYRKNDNLPERQVKQEKADEKSQKVVPAQLSSIPPPANSSLPIAPAVPAPPHLLIPSPSLQHDQPSPLNARPSSSLQNVFQTPPDVKNDLPPTSSATPRTQMGPMRHTPQQAHRHHPIHQPLHGYQYQPPTQPPAVPTLHHDEMQQSSLQPQHHHIQHVSATAAISPPSDSPGTTSSSLMTVNPKTEEKPSHLSGHEPHPAAPQNGHVHNLLPSYPIMDGPITTEYIRERATMLSERANNLFLQQPNQRRTIRNALMRYVRIAEEMPYLTQEGIYREAALRARFEEDRLNGIRRIQVPRNE